METLTQKIQRLEKHFAERAKEPDMFNTVDYKHPERELTPEDIELDNLIMGEIYPPKSKK